MPIIPCQRHLFDIPEDVAYLNCAYQGPLLKATTEALTSGAHRKARPWTVKPTDFFDEPEHFRQLLSEVTGAPADNFAIVPSASYGIATAAQTLSPHLGPHDEILMIAETFPSTYLTWKRVADETGSKINMVPTPSDHDWTSAILESLTPATKLVSLPQCHWSNGAMIDLEKVSDAARANGAFLVLDLTQSLTAIPFDFARIGADFVATAGYKWMLFPYSLSSLYVDPKWHDARPLEETWMNREGAHIFEKLAEYSGTYQTGARRFDMGEKTLPSILPGGVAALEQVKTWGINNIAETLTALTDRIANMLEDVGLTPVPRAFRAPNILGASAKNGLPADLLPKLAERKIYISQRGTSLRISPYLYTSEQDLLRFETALTDVFGSR